MKAVVATAVICVIASVLGLLAVSAMTVAPAGKRWHRNTLLAVATLMLVWLALRLLGQVAIPFVEWNRCRTACG